MRDIYVPKKQPKSKSLPLAKLIKYGLIIIALIIIVYFGFRIFNNQIDKWLELEPIDLKKIEKSVSDSPKVKAIPQPDNKKSSSTKPNQTPTIVKTTLPSIKSEDIKPD